jgi:predicted PurR-regulated permease PerM
VVSTTVGVVTSVVVVLFVGLFAAIDPGLYARGMVKLFPRQRQPRIRQVIAAVDHTLHWWIAGQAITMVVIGTLTGVGLWILGVPLALLLGVLAALLNFIPTFGPVIAFIPAALLALTQSPATFAYVLILWLIAQNLEGHVLTPLIQRRTVDLPPVLTILAQVIFATLFGVIGVVVAAPMTAVLLVIIKMLYVEDVLGNKVDIPAVAATAGRDTEGIAADTKSG